MLINLRSEDGHVPLTRGLRRLFQAVCGLISQATDEIFAREGRTGGQPAGKRAQDARKAVVSQRGMCVSPGIYIYFFVFTVKFIGFSVKELRR